MDASAVVPSTIAAPHRGGEQTAFSRSVISDVSESFVPATDDEEEQLQPALDTVAEEEEVKAKTDLSRRGDTEETTPPSVKNNNENDDEEASSDAKELPCFKAQTSTFIADAVATEDSGDNSREAYLSATEGGETTSSIFMSAIEPEQQEPDEEAPPFKAQTSSTLLTSTDGQSNDNSSNGNSNTPHLPCFKDQTSSELRASTQQQSTTAATTSTTNTDSYIPVFKMSDETTSGMAEAQAILVPVEEITAATATESRSRVATTATESKHNAPRSKIRWWLYSASFFCVGIAVALIAICTTGQCSATTSETPTTPLEPPSPTLAPPDPARITTLQAFLKQQLNQTISYPPLTFTPQELALQWLLETDTLQATVGSTPKQQILQRYVLAVWDFSSTSTVSFLVPGRHECTWSTIVRGCIDGSSITQLVASNSQLQGSSTLPTELTALSLLTIVSLPNTGLAGTLPSTLSSWPLLEEWNVAGNQLTGPLPAASAQQQNLRIFSVTDNMLTGTLPAAYAQWTNLEHLGLSKNAFRGTIPEAWGAAWPFLQTFQAHENQLTGTIPIAAQWTRLEAFHVNNNRLTGTVPDFASPRLENLFLYSNQLTGTINCTSAAGEVNIVADCNGDVGCPCCSLCCPGPSWCS